MVSSFKMQQAGSPLKIKMQNSTMHRPGHNRRLDDITDTKLVNIDRQVNGTPMGMTGNLI